MGENSMRLHFLLLMSLLLLGITFKEEASANPAPAPIRYRGYYGTGGHPSVSGYKYGYGKRSAEPEPEADPYHRYYGYRGGRVMVGNCMVTVTMAMESDPII